MKMPVKLAVGMAKIEKKKSQEFHSPCYPDKMRNHPMEQKNPRLAPILANLQPN